MYDELQHLKRLSQFSKLNENQILAIVELSKAKTFDPHYLLFEE